MIRLLKMIQNISYSHKSKSYPFVTVHRYMKALYASHQSNNNFYNSYMESLTNLRGVITHCGGSLWEHPYLIMDMPKETEVDPP